MIKKTQKAELWNVSHWLNTGTPIDLGSLYGRVIVLLAFQMSCRGCARIALPQLQRVYETFSAHPVSVIGLHTVFEQHSSNNSLAGLEAFLKQNRYRFPVGIDMAVNAQLIPDTMQRYQIQGTPSLILIDRCGYLRRQTAGTLSDLMLGAEIMALLMEDDVAG